MSERVKIKLKIKIKIILNQLWELATNEGDFSDLYCNAPMEVDENHPCDPTLDLAPWSKWLLWLSPSNLSRWKLRHFATFQ